MRSLPTNQLEDVHGQIGRVVRQRGGQVAWRTIEYCVRPWSEVHIEVLVVTTESVGHCKTRRI